jgi:hypothetical protein
MVGGWTLQITDTKHVGVPCGRKLSRKLASNRVSVIITLIALSGQFVFVDKVGNT